MKLLLVEDDANTADALKMCLSIYDSDLQLDITGLGKMAVTMCIKDDYDGILLDLGLPDIDGTEVIKKIRIFSSAPVMVISAKNKHEVITQAISMGADDYILKPFDNKTLFDHLKKVFYHQERMELDMCQDYFLPDSLNKST